MINTRIQCNLICMYLFSVCFPGRTVHMYVINIVCRIRCDRSAQAHIGHHVDKVLFVRHWRLNTFFCSFHDSLKVVLEGNVFTLSAATLIVKTHVQCARNDDPVNRTHRSKSYSKLLQLPQSFEVLVVVFITGQFVVDEMSALFTRGPSDSVKRREGDVHCQV